MPRFSLIASSLLLAGTGIQPAAAQEPPRVIASIAPVWALVAGVTEGVTEPVLLMDPTISPHDYSLRPSEGQALQDADVVFWVGPQIERYNDVLHDVTRTVFTNFGIAQMLDLNA